MVITTLILGFLFGVALQYANLNRYNVISGLAIREDFSVAKAIALAIGVGAILLNIEIATGLASYHVKPFILGGVILGGLIFGMGMAILGYCPGTLAISMGEGSLDAFIGVIGGLVGGLVYTLLLPFFQTIQGPDFGVISLHSMVGTNALFYLLVFIIGALFIGISFLLNKIDRKRTYRWVWSGIALALLNTVVFSSFASNRPIGASTAYPYLGDLLTGATGNDYFLKIQTPGNWEVIFLLGSFLAGLSFSLIKKEFKFVITHENWIRFKGKSVRKRVIWAFMGGFILIIGARMAGGCTSGHIISGGMQLAVSSLVFAVFVFTGFLITGKLFYNKER